VLPRSWALTFRARAFPGGLPLAPSCDGNRDDPHENVLVIESRQLRLLVVEDDADNAAALQEWLEQGGHSVRVASDACGALELATPYVPDVVVLDIGLGAGIDGFEAARLLRRLPSSERTTLVAVSGYGAVEDKERARAAGFDHHFTKPLDFARFEKLLGEIAANVV